MQRLLNRSRLTDLRFDLLDLFNDFWIGGIFLTHNHHVALNRLQLLPEHLRFRLNNRRLNNLSLGGITLYAAGVISRMLNVARCPLVREEGCTVVPCNLVIDLRIRCLRIANR